MARKPVILVLGVLLVAGFVLYSFGPLKEARIVNSIVAKNIEARGGSAWDSVTAMRIAGQMDLGQDMAAPYTLEQKRPGMMCFELEFGGETATQCTDGSQGWKIVPFQNRLSPEPMTETEYRETADASDPFGLLYDYSARGVDIAYQGIQEIDNRDVHKLEVRLPHGGLRWLYLDAETGLEVKLEAYRTLAGKEYRVDTWFRDWAPTDDGLLIARTQETATEGDEVAHFLTVDEVVVNPDIPDERFRMPATATATQGGRGDSSWQ